MKQHIYVEFKIEVHTSWSKCNFERCKNYFVFFKRLFFLQQVWIYVISGRWIRWPYTLKFVSYTVVYDPERPVFRPFGSDSITAVSWRIVYGEKQPQTAGKTSIWSFTARQNTAVILSLPNGRNTMNNGRLRPGRVWPGIRKSLLNNTGALSTVHQLSNV